MKATHVSAYNFWFAFRTMLAFAGAGLVAAALYEIHPAFFSIACLTSIGSLYGARFLTHGKFVANLLVTAIIVLVSQIVLVQMAVDDTITYITQWVSSAPIMAAGLQSFFVMVELGRKITPLPKP